jgi:hypothetical protein
MKKKSYFHYAFLNALLFIGHNCNPSQAFWCCQGEGAVVLMVLRVVLLPVAAAVGPGPQQRREDKSVRAVDSIAAPFSVLRFRVVPTSQDSTN